MMATPTTASLFCTKTRRIWTPRLPAPRASPPAGMPVISLGATASKPNGIGVDPVSVA